MELRVHEILKATNGVLLQGNPALILRGASNDSRRLSPGELFVPLKGATCDGHFFIADAFARGAAAAFIQRHHPLSAELQKHCSHKTLIEVADPLRALGDVAHAWRTRLSLTVVAITGSNGKTTTKEMAWHIVNQRFSAFRNPGNWNNLIGLPLSLIAANRQHQVAILEMGMSARGEIQRLAEIAVPDIGLITNIGPAHLEQLHTIENIMAAKGELFAALRPEGTAVVNQDDARVVSLAHNTRAHVVTYGISAGDVRGMLSSDTRTSTIVSIAIGGEKVSVTLPAGLCVSNALAAAAIGHALQMPLADIKRGLEQFQPLSGRMEFITLGAVTIINDAYNANPVSVERSLQTLSLMKNGSRRIAVLGDMLELGAEAAAYHRQAGYRAAQLGIDYLFLFGTFATAIADGARAGAMPEQQILIFDSKPALAQSLLQTLKPGDRVLIKGSRATGMEQIVQFLQQNAPQEQANG